MTAHGKYILTFYQNGFKLICRRNNELDSEIFRVTIQLDSRQVQVLSFSWFGKIRYLEETLELESFHLPAAWVMTVCVCRSHSAKWVKKKKKSSHRTHKGADWICCHGNPILQLSSAHQFPQQHSMVERVDNYFRRNTVERVKWRPY